MIAKSQTEEGHLVDLAKLFDRLRQFRLRLNPNKCTFGVRSGKLLGFIVSEKGIEVDPAKVKAIREMPEPRMEREVRGLLGRLNYMSWFTSPLTATWEPIQEKRIKRSGCSPTETVCAGSYHFVDFEMDLISAQQPVEDYQPMKFEFPNEDISSALVTPKGSHVPFVSRIAFERADNVASTKLVYRVSNLGAPIGETPFSLVYGMEAVLPVEVQIPSLRVLMDVKLQEAKWVRTRYEESNLIEEKRLAAICHGQLYQQRMKRAFDGKVRPRVYHVGDMVLKRILPPQNDRRGKWTPNYEGPFVVKKVLW
ncbi:hypothetical protein KIW84_062327 [Lathyrus oleraceus]|uniref:Uncharacterized protein n=1 Tax=Pisum sativum TaxID=3888 RepID=A0A9D4W651_PEA|nr:hypothetical protein KIW84_062327 [Pisum sativum]